jgi:hypothetical protein
MVYTLIILVSKSTFIIQVRSRQTLDQAPWRTIAFLRAVGNDPSIQAPLASVGFTADDFERGWTLLRKVVGRMGPVVAWRAPDPTPSAREQLMAWIGPSFARARAALRHLHPEQEAFVFHRLGPTRGTEAVLTVTQFLARLEALETGAKKTKARAAVDRAALSTLEQRGFTKAERRRVHALVDAVTAAPVDAVELPEPPPAEDRRADLMALHAWLSDWSDTARAVIKRRDQLIRLGIGARRQPKKQSRTRTASLET